MTTKRDAAAMLDTEALINTARDLIRIPSVYNPARPDGNESMAADYVCALLERWAIPYVRREVAQGRPNIVADLPGTRPGPILVLEGHTDVVTAGDPGAWSVEPFGAVVRDGRLYGRGSVDMKGGLAAMLQAARAIQLAGCDFAGTLRLAILADEEGLMLGAKGFVADGWLDGVSAAITCEPESDAICISQKGAIRLRVRLVGRMAHGCMPDEGVNPTAALGEVLVALRGLEREIQGEQPAHPLLGRFHLTPTVAAAGEREQVNVIPGAAELFIDIRTTHQHQHAEIHARAREVIARAAASISGIVVEVETLDDRPATETDPEDPIVQSLIAAHRRVTGEPPRLGGVPGTTDLPIFWAATQLPVVAYGPGTVTLAHQVDENVALDDLVRYGRVYVDAVLSYFEMHERGQV
jgi:succinyl-diaminopimelate desuccinylase